MSKERVMKIKEESVRIFYKYKKFLVLKKYEGPKIQKAIIFWGPNENIKKIDDLSVKKSYKKISIKI